MERCEVRMLAQVTTCSVKTATVEISRIPVQCQSEQGESGLSEWRKPHAMDTRLIFRDLNYGNGGTKNTNGCPSLDWGLCVETRILGKSGIHKSRGKQKPEASADGIFMKSLPRKSSSIQHNLNRT